MSERIDTRSKEGAICPHCGHMHRAADENWTLYDENTSEWQCHACDREFAVNVMASFSWETEASE